MTLARVLAVACLALVGSGCTLAQARTAAVIGTAADMTTTAMALHEGLREANPLYSGLEHPAIVSGAVSLLGVALVEEAVRQNPYNAEGATWFYRIFAAARISAATVNAVRIVQHRRKGEKGNASVALSLRVTW